MYPAASTGRPVLPSPPVRQARTRRGVSQFRVAPVLCGDGKRQGVVCPGVHCVLHASTLGHRHLFDVSGHHDKVLVRQGLCAPDAPDVGDVFVAVQK